jgi:predicted CopG family antitoxin
MVEEEKIQNAWKIFQNKLAELRKKRHDVLMRISGKIDDQHMEKLRKKLQNNE